MKLNTKLGRSLVALLIVASTATSASADWNSFWYGVESDWNHFQHGVHVGYARNNAWPDPFNEIDAQQVIEPFAVMKANGWRMNNTIGHDLFRNGDGALLAAGYRRVQWIATQAPPDRRTVHVLRGSNPAETEARVAAVQSTLENIDIQGPRPNVLVTDVNPATSSGAIATKINREMLENLPSPRLPAQSSSGSQGIATPSGN